MVRRKTLVAVFVCSLALLITFVSAGSAHAASRASTVALHPILSNTHNPCGTRCPQGPPGCYDIVGLQVARTEPPITYHGSQFVITAALYGWYLQLQDGQLASCNAVFCATGVQKAGNNIFPAGNMETSCDFDSGVVDKWTRGGASDGVSSNEVPKACGNQAWANASYKPAGATGAFTISTTDRYFLPCIL